MEERLKDTEDIGGRSNMSGQSFRSREQGKAIFKEIIFQNTEETSVLPFMKSSESWGGIIKEKHITTHVVVKPRTTHTESARKKRQITKEQESDCELNS